MNLIQHLKMNIITTIGVGILMAVTAQAGVIFSDDFSGGTMAPNWTLTSSTTNDTVAVTSGALRMTTAANTLGNATVTSTTQNLTGMYPTLNVDFSYPDNAWRTAFPELFYKQQPTVTLKFDSQNYISVTYNGANGGKFYVYAYQNGVAVVNGTPVVVPAVAYADMHMAISVTASSFTLNTYDKTTLTPESYTYNYSWPTATMNTAQILLSHQEIQNGARSYYIDYDNVVLSGTAVPEPAALSLLALGVLGLMHRRRR